MNPQDPLSQLRDIHLPDPAGFWPPAPGWWVLFALALIALAALVVWQLRRYLRQRWKKPALTELQRLARADQTDERWYTAVNEILKRSAMACFPHRYPQSLTGKEWADFLTDTWPGKDEPPRKLLLDMAHASWSPNADCSAEEALRAAEFWIRRQPC